MVLASFTFFIVGIEVEKVDKFISRRRSRRV